jgi:SPP1 gp7 family putative phage head morphogenesis protein
MVLARRKRSWALEAKASASITRALSSVATEAKRQLARMDAGFAPDGHFLDTAQARRAAQAAIDDVKDTIKSATAKSGLILSGVNETAFNQSLLDVNYAIETATGLNADMGASFNQIFQQAAYQARTREVMDVSPIRAFTGTGAWMEDRYRETFMEAVVNGESVQATSNKLRKISGITDRAAQRITRTNVQAAFNDAHRLVYESNDDLFDGFIWVSTLDELTSQICAALDGKFFPLGSSPPGPPAHPNCRSVLVGHFRDPDLQAEQENDERRARQFTPEGDRYQPDSGALVGTELIPADTTYDEWLMQQPPAVTRQVTGSRLRDEFWRNGTLQLEELINPAMEPLTDTQAVRRVASKFPANAHYQELAKKYGVTPVDWKTILKEDRALIRSSPHTQPKTLKPKKKPKPPGPQPLTETEKVKISIESAPEKAKADDIVQSGKDASAARIEETVPDIPDAYKFGLSDDSAQEAMAQVMANKEKNQVVQAILKGEDPKDAAYRIGKQYGRKYTAAEVEEMKRTALSLQYRAQTETLKINEAHYIKRMDEAELKTKFAKGSQVQLDALTDVYESEQTAAYNMQGRLTIPKAGEAEVHIEFYDKNNKLVGAKAYSERYLARGSRWEVTDVVEGKSKMGDTRYTVKMRQLDDVKPPWYSMDEFAKEEQDYLRMMGLDKTGITRAEYNAMKKEFDDLILWRGEMNKVPPPPMPLNPGDIWRDNMTNPNLLGTRFMEAGSRNMEMEYAARSKLAMYRAQKEMDALGLTTDFIVNNPELAAQRIIQEMARLNKSADQLDIIDLLVDKARKGIGHATSFYSPEGKFGGDLEAALSVFRKHLETMPANQLSTKSVQSLRWTGKHGVRSGWSPSANAIEVNSSTEGRELIHEFNHPFEVHNNFGGLSAGQRDSYFSGTPFNEWEIREMNTGEYTMNAGKIWSDYTARSYSTMIEANEYTEIMTKVGDSLHIIGQNIHVPKEYRDDALKMFRRNPELLRFYWALLRNMAR